MTMHDPNSLLEALNVEALTEFDILEKYPEVRVAFRPQGGWDDVVSLYVREDGKHFAVARSSCCFGDMHEFAKAYARASKFVEDNNLIQEPNP